MSILWTFASAMKRQYALCTRHQLGFDRICHSSMPCTFLQTNVHSTCDKCAVQNEQTSMRYLPKRNCAASMGRQKTTTYPMLHGMSDIRSLNQMLNHNRCLATDSITRWVTCRCGKGTFPVTKRRQIGESKKIATAGKR